MRSNYVPQKLKLNIAVFLVSVSFSTVAQETMLPYQTQCLSFDERVDDLSYFDVLKQAVYVEPGSFEIGVEPSLSNVLKREIDVLEYIIAY